MDFNDFSEKYKDVDREKLIDDFYKVSQAQSGVDKKVKEYQAENETLKEKVANYGDDGGQLLSAAQKLKEREKIVALREAGVDYAVQEGLSPKLGAMLAAQNELQTKQNIDEVLAEIEQLAGAKTEAEVKDRFKGDNNKPKVVRDSNNFPSDYQDMMAWFADGGKNLPPGMINDLVDKEIAKDDKKKRLHPRLRRKA